MAKRQHYLHLTSKDSLDFHPDNTAADFVVELPDFVDLSGKWECALLEFKCDPLLSESGWVLVFSDLCTQSYVKDAKLPLLRKVDLAKAGVHGYAGVEFNLPHYLQLASREIRRLRIYLTDEDCSNLSLSANSSPTSCTLHLREL